MFLALFHLFFGEICLALTGASVRVPWASIGHVVKSSLGGVRNTRSVEVFIRDHSFSLLFPLGECLMHRLPKTRHSLLIRLADPANHAAWAEFLRVYEVAIYRYACSRGVQPVDAEDITQKVLAAVMDKAREWEPDSARGSFGAWLFQVTQNLSAKAWNDRKRGVVGTGDSGVNLILNQIPEPAEEEMTVFHLEYRRALFHWAAEQVRDQVEPTTWRAFWMTAVEAQKSETVAQTLGLSMSSVYTARCRVLAKIRKAIQGFDKGLDDDGHTTAAEGALS